LALNLLYKAKPMNKKIIYLFLRLPKFLQSVSKYGKVFVLAPHYKH